MHELIIWATFAGAWLLMAVMVAASVLNTTFRMIGDAHQRDHAGREPAPVADQGLLYDHFRLLVLALAEVMVPDAPLRVGEVQGGPVGFANVRQCGVMTSPELCGRRGATRTA